MTMTAVGGGEDGGHYERGRVSLELHGRAGETLPRYGGAVGGDNMSAGGRRCEEKTSSVLDLQNTRVMHRQIL